MFWLLVIGLVHAYLIWGGDILVPYALCGILLLWWVRRLPAWALAAAAVLLLGIGAAFSIGHGFAWERMSEAERAQEAAMMAPTPEQAQSQLAALLGTYVESLASRASFVFMGHTFFFAFFFFWRCGGMMLLGMALYKWGFLDGRRPARDYAVVAFTCIPIGLALAWYGSVALESVRYAMPQRTTADVWNYVGAVLASVGYAAALILVVKHAVLARLRTALAAVGQTALSNYLFQSVITSAMFLGCGLALAGRFDYAEQLIVVVAIWAFQLALSPVWVKRYSFGPAEWLWRSLTYGRRQPMRRPMGAAVGAPAAP
jgi:uncharacterized protein